MLDDGYTNLKLRYKFRATIENLNTVFEIIY